MNRRHLSRAARLYAVAKYREVIRLLELRILDFQENEQYFLLLGLCHIHCRRINDATTYLQRGLRINDRNCHLLQALAVCAYMRNRPAESISYLLTSLEIDSRYKRANAFLQFIQTRSNLEPRPSGGEQLERVRPFLPRRGYRIGLAVRPLLIGAAIGLGAVGVALLVTVYLASTSDPAAARAGYEEILNAQQAEQYIDFGVSARYVFNAEQIGDLLAAIERDFLRHADNEVCINTNRILNSNAHAHIKQRMIFLRSYFNPPTFALSFIEHAYDAVAAEPYLYNSCYVRWRGSIANIDVGAGMSAFDFLVGYDSGNVLEGVVRAVSELNYDFRVPGAYEVIAQVRGTREQFELYITAIRPL